MDFGLSEDQTLFRDTLRGYLAEHVPMERVRSVMESASGYDAAVLSGLAAQGVAGIVTPADQGGSELGLLDAAVAAEELGRAATPVSFHTACVMAPMVLAAAAACDAVAARWLGDCAAGNVLLSVVEEGVTESGGTLQGNVVAVADAATADALLVFADGDAPAFYLMPGDTAGLSVTERVTIDTTRRLADVSVTGIATEGLHRLEIDDVVSLRDRVVDAGRIVLAADAVGVTQRSLDEAVAYALTREQFGRVIGSFQAVKHMCAEIAAALEPVRSLLWYAAFAFDSNDAESPYVTALLKSHATEVATESVATAVQVFGGMGFTYECDMQIWFKRAGYDRQLLGGPAALRRSAAERVLRSAGA